jgi:hypothetical protein
MYTPAATVTMSLAASALLLLLPAVANAGGAWEKQVYHC